VTSSKLGAASKVTGRKGGQERLRATQRRRMSSPRSSKTLRRKLWSLIKVETI